jgi:hypothetical protein
MQWSLSAPSGMCRWSYCPTFVTISIISHWQSDCHGKHVVFVPTKWALGCPSMDQWENSGSHHLTVHSFPVRSIIYRYKYNMQPGNSSQNQSLKHWILTPSIFMWCTAWEDSITYSHSENSNSYKSRIFYVK